MRKLSYYDNVKDNIKNESNGGGSSGEKNSSGGNFDALKEAASDTNPEEEGGDDTPIEVLEEDGVSRESPRKQEQKRQREQQQRQNPDRGQQERNQDANPDRGSRKNNTGGTDVREAEGSSGSVNPLKSEARGESSSSGGEDLSGVEDRLDRIIEQNQEMIEILRSFAE